MSKEIKRFIIDIKGIVQGVGFRPFIYNLAKKQFLYGWVTNYPGGVKIEVEGSESELDEFVQRIRLDAPPISYIEGLSFEKADAIGYKDFTIKESIYADSHDVFISSDISICDDCLNEMNSPEDRRYLYPFINCTNCGPRFTITTNIPYDRVNTTMHTFDMCEDCAKEYHDPSNRRFHAQPIACSKCGPELFLMDHQGNRIESELVTDKVCELLSEGKIIAIKGLGGYHLACDARNTNAVRELRKRKFRDGKPFALMAKNIETVSLYCNVSKEESNLLQSIKRPIVLLDRKPDDNLCMTSLSSDNKKLGVMLPYTPLHHLLFRGNMDLLVMTSGNKSGEPIFYKDDDAIKGLKDIADYFLINNREIYIRTDDSVTSVFRNREYIIRRSRGYVPFPIDITCVFHSHGEKCTDKNIPTILTCGGELKNTFCITKGTKVFLSHHIGDLENIETMESFEDGIEHFKKIFTTNPTIVAFDKHPEYLSTKYVNTIKDMLKIQVQHHHAHIASCMAENGIVGRVIGVAFDGTGFGDDGHIWGGEFFIGDYSGFQRLAHFEYIPLPGGNIGIKEPWRMALSYLMQYCSEDLLHDNNIDFLNQIESNKINIVKQQILKRINTPLTSSIGRLFDAVSSLVGLCNIIEYEGQAAIKLENTARLEEMPEAYPFDIKQEDGKHIITVEPLIKAIVKDISNSRGASWISGAFHKTVAKIILDICSSLRTSYGLTDVVLSGGVFQNNTLLKLTVKALEDKGFTAHTHSKVPANDGGIALGQAAIALRKYIDGDYHLRKD